MSARNSFITTLPRAGPSTPRLPRSWHRKASTASPWPSRTHLKPSTPPLPAPVPAIYPQKILLSDGSTFTSYTTAPTPSIVRLTRDVTNNPLWAPGTDKRGLGDGVEEGRVGRFRRMFDMGAAAPGSAAANASGGGETKDAGKGAKRDKSSFGETDFEWMSEGAKEDTVGAKQMGGAVKTKAPGKKK